QGDRQRDPPSGGGAGSGRRPALDGHGTTVTCHGRSRQQRAGRLWITVSPVDGGLTAGAFSARCGNPVHSSCGSLKVSRLRTPSAGLVPVGAPAPSPLLPPAGRPRQGRPGPPPALPPPPTPPAPPAP